MKFRDAWASMDLTPFGNVLVITIGLILAATVLCAFSCERKGDNYYSDLQVRIVSINGDCSLTADKFHKPQLCNVVLFETLTEPTRFMEINTCNNTSLIHIDTPWLYNHQPGDTVHFDYILKSRFFEIRKR